MGREGERDEGSEEDETEVFDCPLRTVLSRQLGHNVLLFILYTMLQFYSNVTSTIPFRFDASSGRKRREQRWLKK